MAGTFGSFNTAITGMRYNRIAMDVASSNIQNASVEGYTRRRVEGETVGAPSVPALWSRYDGAGEGVKVTTISRLTDALLESRVRREGANQSFLNTRATSLARFENGLAEPGDKGVSAKLGELRKAWSDLSTQPTSQAARQQVLTQAGATADAIRLQAANVATEIEYVRAGVDSDLNQANVIAKDLAKTNEAIMNGKLEESDVNALLDTRDLLATKLAALTGAQAVEQPNGSVTVTLNGVNWITGDKAGALAASGTSNPTSFALTDSTGAATTLASAPGGSIGGAVDLLDHTYPDYLAQLNEFAKSFAEQVNTQHAAGFDANGDAGGALFAFDPDNPAATLQVAITDPAKLAASAVDGSANTDTGNASLLAHGPGQEGAYQRIVNGLGTSVASAQRLAENQQVVTSQAQSAREQQTGVSLDEEMVNLMTSQRGFEAASRLITAIDSMLDTLINRTGLVGR